MRIPQPEEGKASVTEQQTECAGGTRPPWFEEVAVWLALLLALSPALYDLMGHWHLHSWSRYSLGFLPLLILAIRGDAPGRPMRGFALALIALCLVGQVIGLFGSVIFVARPLVGVAVAGALVYRGLARPRIALLALCLIPVPGMMMRRGLAAEDLAHFLTGVAASVVSTLGVSARIAGSGSVVMVRDLQLEVGYQWGGVLLAVQALGLGWYYSVRRNLGMRATVVALMVAVLLAFPVQLGVLVSSSLALWAGQPSLAGLLLNPGSWLLPLFMALYLTEVRDTAKSSLAP